MLIIKLTKNITEDLVGIPIDHLLWRQSFAAAMRAVNSRQTFPSWYALRPDGVRITTLNRLLSPVKCAAFSVLDLEV